MTTFVLETQIELSAEYDSEEDILYAWVGGEPREAVTYETNEGHLVRLDPETNELVGVTIFDFQARWADRPITLEWETVVERPVPWIPRIARKRERVAERRVFHPRPPLVA